MQKCVRRGQQTSSGGSIYLLKIFTRKKAPAATLMTTKNMKALMCHYFYGIDLEKGACGSYNNKQESMNELDNGLINSLTS